MINTTEEIDILRSMSDELSEIRFWLKLSGLPLLQRLITEYLKSDEEKSVYDLSDGLRSTRDIVTELGKNGISITHTTVANMWKRWATVGIVEPSKKYRGRFARVKSLESLGIDVPNKSQMEEG